MSSAALSIVERIRPTLDASGVAFWLFDTEGRLVSSTNAPGMSWTESALVRAMQGATAEFKEVMSGWWACGFDLAEPCRGLRIALGVAGRTEHGGEPRQWCRFDADSASAVLAMSREWVSSACTLADHDHTIEGFTGQLSQAFDNIDCLYAMGRAMHDPTKPKEFLRFVCDRVRTSTDFGWVSARFTGDEHDVATLTDKFYLSGTPTAEIGEVVRVSGDLATKSYDHRGAQILPSVPGLSKGPNPQVLVHPIQRGVGPGGALFASEKRGSDPAVSSWDIQLFEAAAGFITSYLENVSLFEEQRRLFMGTLQALTAAIDAKDRYTRGHSERVSHVSTQIARAIGLSAEDVETIRIAGLVHDVGKIGVPEAVLCKQGRLTDPEFDAIKRHPQIGYGILQDIRPLKGVLPGVLHHHERWDGKGYPSGLSGESIPLQARIIAIADTFDAMSSTRSYRPAMPRDKVLAELQRCAGTQFDPALIPAFMRLDLSEFDLLVAKHAAAEQTFTPSLVVASEDSKSAA
jgi:HD-GYP domain-containing protein (c-di-GMP phosphodiesterase class II)